MDETSPSSSNGTQNIEDFEEDQVDNSQIETEEEQLEAGQRESEQNQIDTSHAGNESLAKKRTRVVRPYPIQPFEDALQLAEAIQQHASGKPVRRITLFDALEKSPESSQNRNWVTSASRYGLIKGTAQSEWLELTDEGRVASDDKYSDYERTEVRANLAIIRIPTFKALYDELAGNKFPARQFLVDTAKSIVPENLVKEALDIFTVNAKFVGLLRIMSGVERLIRLEHLLELLSNESIEPKINTITSTDHSEIIDEYENDHPTITSMPVLRTGKNPLEEICFYVTPIGEAGSEQRQHADLFLNYIIQPALDGTGLKVVRADKIDRPGVIGSQIIRHLLLSRLVIADLSFHNPNVFYELAIRHASRLPTVHIVRASDPIPFDLNHMRTIKIDSTNIYTLIPQLDTYKAEIATQVRRALDGEENPDNPISVFYPSFRVTFE